MNTRVTLLVLVALLYGAVPLACAGIRAAQPFTVMVAGDIRPQLAPVAAYDGEGVFLVVWQQGRFYHEGPSADILAARIDLNGRVLDASPIVLCAVAGSQEQPQLAYAEGHFLVLWQDLRNGRDWDVYASRVDSGGRVLDPGGFVVAAEAGSQASPVLAPARRGFLTVWQQYDGRYYTLHAARISSSGELSERKSLAFRDQALAGGNPALVRAGTGWLLSWHDEQAWTEDDGAGGTITRRFAALRQGAGGVEVQAVGRSPAVSLGELGGRFAAADASSVLYAGWGTGGRGNRVATGALFPPEAVVALPNPNVESRRQWSGWNTRQMFTIFDAGLPLDGPVGAAFGGGVYLLAAREAYSGNPDSVAANRILGMRMSADGRRLDAGPAWPVLHESRHRIGSPFLAAGDGRFLLVFEEEDAAGRRLLRARMIEVD